MRNFIETFETTIQENWNNYALGEYDKEEITYGELAEEIAMLQNLWSVAGLKPGDKIALHAKSCSNWAKIFFAAVSGGYVSVQLFNGYTHTDTQNLVNHSDSKIFYTEKNAFAKMDFNVMPNIIGVIDAYTGELLASRGSFNEIYESCGQTFKNKYPNGFHAEDVVCYDCKLDDVCAIMYTSGSTGSPKGVMLTIRNFSANVDLIPGYFPYRRGENYLSILPFAHIFGLMCDVILPLVLGMRTVILGKPPIPLNVKDAMCSLKPHIFFAVPLIMEKFVEYTIGDVIHTESGKEKLMHPEENADFCLMLRDIVMTALGGNVEAFATGGAAIPPEIESLLAFKLKVPFVTGYGMTECAPVISLGHVGRYKTKSCGECNPDYIKIRIDSIDPHNVAGEILIKGDSVFSGYYKNPEITKSVITEDGWFHTGDIGTIDQDNTLFIVGRCKSMLLSTNGQNIYPEETEVLLNELPYVAESIIVQRESRLYAIIVTDGDAAANDNIDSKTLQEIMRQNIVKLNVMIPDYAMVSGFHLQFEPFAKTPKGSIKRFMYS